MIKSTSYRSPPPIPPATAAVAAFIRHTGRQDVSQAATMRRRRGGRKRSRSKSEQSRRRRWMYRYDNINSLSLFFLFVFPPLYYYSPRWESCIFWPIVGSLRIRVATSLRHLIFPAAEELRRAPARPRLHPGSDACGKKKPSLPRRGGDFTLASRTVEPKGGHCLSCPLVEASHWECEPVKVPYCCNSRSKCDI